MKSKIEIIQEVAAAYNINTRAVDDKCCSYQTSDGRQCAVGRALTPAAIQGLIDTDNMGCRASFITCFLDPDKYSKDGNDDINDYLKEEYKGHHITFWSSLQNLHDRKEHWNENGLSEKGKQHMEGLLVKWNGK